MDAYFSQLYLADRRAILAAAPAEVPFLDANHPRVVFNLAGQSSLPDPTLSLPAINLTGLIGVDSGCGLAYLRQLVGITRKPTAVMRATLLHHGAVMR